MATIGSITSYWIKFFKDAGIPPGDAANYAVTFNDHRIQVDMLMDLSKEILNDMNITMMGDVIAILKHAKMVHSQNAREKALQASEPPPVTVAATSAPGKRSTPASRFVDRYIGNDPDAKAMSAPATKVTCTLPKDVSTLLSTTDGVSIKKSSVFERLGKESSPARNLVELPKPRGVTITGLDKVTVNKSSTQDSSVFSRLGGQAVKRPATSTSVDDDPLEYAGLFKESPTKKTKVTIQVVEKKAVAPAIQKTSIQSRLGPVQTQSVKAEASTTTPVITEGILSPYARVEKPSLKKRLGGTSPGTSSKPTTTVRKDIVSTKPSAVTQMRAFSGKTKGVKTVTINPSSSIKLGSKKLTTGSSEVSSTNELKADLVSAAKKTSVFGRLGKQVSK